MARASETSKTEIEPTENERQRQQAAHNESKGAMSNTKIHSSSKRPPPEPSTTQSEKRGREKNMTHQSQRHRAANGGEKDRQPQKTRAEGGQEKERQRGEE